MMYEIFPELYDEVARNLIDRLGGKEYFSGSFEFDFEGITCKMVLSAIIYYEADDRSVGYVGGVKDVVPVWWEFHTMGEGGEVLNDFSFNDLRNVIKQML